MMRRREWRNHQSEDADQGEHPGWINLVRPSDGHVEVTACLFEPLSVSLTAEIMAALVFEGAFVFGRGDNSQIGFRIEGTNETEACRYVTAKLLEFKDLVITDVHPGPFAPTLDAEEFDARFDEFMDRLDQRLQNQVTARIKGYVEPVQGEQDAGIDYSE